MIQADQVMSVKAIPQILPGSGRISLECYGPRAVLSDLSSAYPLKLISPATINRNVAVVYVLCYGGGLVAGDNIDLSINVGGNAILVLRSQGSTKVFKSRPESRLASVQQSQSKCLDSFRTLPDSLTKQTMTATVAPGGTIFLLPDPVTCFKSASYAQTQIIHLSEDASLLLLDWFTSGRLLMGEEWDFAQYYSSNEVWVGGKRIAKDVTLLDESGSGAGGLPFRSLGDRLSPYSCYAMVLLYGPLLRTVIDDLISDYDKISVFRTRVPEDIIWSLSPLTAQGGYIVRVAGKETEQVKKWLCGALLGVQDIVGTDAYRSTFSS